jgi:hypothetical protein
VNQSARVVDRSRDPHVTFPYRNAHKDRASRLDHARGHGRLRDEALVNDYSDTSRPIVCGETVTSERIQIVQKVPSISF